MDNERNTAATRSKWRVERYAPCWKKAWDELVDRSKNGTFLLRRDYMDYHADRFADCSLLLLHGGKLLAALPGNVCEGHFYSHQGLTYGGLLMSPAITYAQVAEALALAFDYLRGECGVARVTYKAIPYIYHRYPAEEDLYVLHRMGARLAERSIASAAPVADLLPLCRLRRRRLKAAAEAGFSIVEDEDFAAFWPVLEANLMERHGARPVHTLDEIARLHRAFPEQIRLFRVCLDGRTEAGCVMYLTDCVAHAQYSSATPFGKEHGAMDLLYRYLSAERYPDKRYFDFGISTEQGGRVLNDGLLAFKEGFGTRAVMYDVYELELPGQPQNH